DRSLKSVLPTFFIPAEAYLHPSRERAMSGTRCIPLLRRDVVEIVARSGVLDVDVELLAHEGVIREGRLALPRLLTAHHRRFDHDSPPTIHALPPLAGGFAANGESRRHMRPRGSCHSFCSS